VFPSQALDAMLVMDPSRRASADAVLHLPLFVDEWAAEEEPEAKPIQLSWTDGDVVSVADAMRLLDAELAEAAAVRAMRTQKSCEF
jgi:hypothetical protein